MDNALAELRDACPDLNEIVRVDVDDSGTLTLTARGAAVTRWFTHDERGLIEHTPGTDKKLALAEHLRGADGWEVLSYRPRRRMVVLERRGDDVRVLKGYKRGRSARAALHQDRAQAAMRRGAFRVPRLLAHEERHEALVFEFLEAPEIGLERSQAPRFRRLGELLAAFQDEPHDELHDDLRSDARAPELAAFGVREELEVLDRWSEKVRLVSTLPEGWSEARERLGRRAAELPAPRLGLCHRDLHDRQLHVGPEGLALLDFDLLCRADVALDPANLVAHLRWRARQGLFGAEEAGVEELRAGFLEGLGRSAEPGFAARLAFYTAGTWLRLALVYRLRPRWSPDVSCLVSWADAVLDDSARTD